MTLPDSSDSCGDFRYTPAEHMELFENEIHHALLHRGLRSFKGTPPATDLLAVGFDDFGNGRVFHGK
jgi:hypothetical protein